MVMELIDWAVFSEIVSMDEDEEGFALSLIETFIQQANDTMADIEKLLYGVHDNATLSQLSSKGHYLKGSAAALGFISVQNQCELMQNYGKSIDIEAGFTGCINAFNELKVVLEETRKVLSEYFHMTL